MNKMMGRMTAVVCMGLVAVFMGSSVYAADFVVKVKTDKEVYIEGEPIEIQLIVENTGAPLTAARLFYAAVCGQYSPGPYTFQIHPFPRDSIKISVTEQTYVISESLNGGKVGLIIGGEIEAAEEGSFVAVADSIPSNSEQTIGVVTLSPIIYVWRDIQCVQPTPVGPRPPGVYEVVGQALLERVTVIDGREVTQQVGGQGSTVIKIVAAQADPVMEQLKAIHEALVQMQTAVTQGNTFMQQLSETTKAIVDYLGQIYNTVVANNAMLQKIINKFKL